MRIAVQNALLCFKKDGNGTGVAIATEPSMFVRIVDGNSRSPRRFSVASAAQAKRLEK